MNQDLDYKKYTLGMSPEPRLGIKYIISEKMRFKLCHLDFIPENILSTNSDRDVVNLFTGIISSYLKTVPNQIDGSAYTK